MIDNKDISIIRLYRENLLRRYISLVLMIQTRVVSTEKTNFHLKKVFIDLKNMFETLKILDEEQQNEIEILSKLQEHRLLTIKYEEYFSSSQSISNYNQQLFEFLEVNPIENKSKHQRILPQKFSEIIENYEEFKANILNTKYEKYLDE